MSKKNVIDIVFNASNLNQFEKDTMREIGKISEEAAAKLKATFDLAERNGSSKSQFTGLYRELFDGVVGWAGEDMEIVEDTIDTFVEKINYAQALIKRSKITDLFSGMSINDVNKFLKPYEEVIKKQEEIERLKDKTSKNKKVDSLFEQTTVKDLSSIEGRYKDSTEFKDSYTQKKNDIENYVQSKKGDTTALKIQIEEYSKLVTLFQQISSETFEKGSEESIRQAQELLAISKEMQQIESNVKASNKKIDFESLRKNEFKDIKGINSFSVRDVYREIEPYIRSSIEEQVQKLNKEIEAIYDKSIQSAIERFDTQYEKTQGTKEKIDTYKNQHSDRFTPSSKRSKKSDSNDSNGASPVSHENDDEGDGYGNGDEYGATVGVEPNLNPEEFILEIETQLKESGRKVKVDVEGKVDPEEFIENIENQIPKAEIDLTPVSTPSPVDDNLNDNSGDHNKEKEDPEKKATIPIEPKLDPAEFTQEIEKKLSESNSKVGVEVTPIVEQESFILDVESKLNENSVDVNVTPVVDPETFVVNIENNLGDVKIPIEIEPIVRNEFLKSFLDEKNHSTENCNLSEDEQQLLNEIEKKKKIVNELESLKLQLVVVEDYHDNDAQFASQLPTEEDLQKADLRIKEIFGENRIFNVDQLINDRDNWLKEVKGSLQKYSDLIKEDNLMEISEYELSGMSTILGAESFFDLPENTNTISSNFKKEIERIENEIGELHNNLFKINDDKTSINDSAYSSTISLEEESDLMKSIATHSREAAAAKQEFVEANANVKQSIDESENPLQLEAEFMELVSIYAKEAANAKQEFVQANSDVVESIDNSENPLQLEAAFMEKLATQARAAADAMQDYFDAEKKAKSKEKPQAPQKKEPQKNNSGQQNSGDTSDEHDLVKERYLKESGKWKILSQTGMATDDGYSATYEKNKGQVEIVKFSARKDEEGNYIYDSNGKIDYDISSTVISNYQTLEKEIIKADNALRKLVDDKNQIKQLDSDAETPWLDKQIKSQGQYIKLLNDTIALIEQAQSEVEDVNGNPVLENDFLIDTEAIKEARRKAKEEYNIEKGAKQEKTSAKQNASNKKKQETNAAQVQRVLNKRQIDADRIERSYNLGKNDSLTKYVDKNTQDFKDLSQIKGQIDNLITKLSGQTRNKSNENDFLELDQLIAKYKDLADAKLKANNPTKQQLGGQKLDIAISEQIADYDKLINKAKQYGDNASDIVKVLEQQRNILANTDKDGKRTATNKDYEQAIDIYKEQSAALTTLKTEEVNKQTQTFNELNAKISDYEKIKKRIATGNAFQGDIESANQLEKEILDLENSPILSQEQINKTEKRLFGLYNTLGDIEKETQQNKVFAQTKDTLEQYIGKYIPLRVEIENRQNSGSNTPEMKRNMLKAGELERLMAELTDNPLLSENQISEIQSRLITMYDNIQKILDDNTRDSLVSLLDNKISQYEEVRKKIADGIASQEDIDQSELLYNEILDGLTDKNSKYSKSLTNKQKEKALNRFNNIDKTYNNKDQKKQKNKEAEDIKKSWTDNISVMKEYQKQVSKLNNKKAADRGTGKYAEEIADQEKKVEELEENFKNSKSIIESIVSSADSVNQLQLTADDVADALELIQTAADGSTESISKWHDAIANANNLKINSIDKSVQNYTKNYENLLHARGTDEQSDDYKKWLNNYSDAIDNLKKAEEKLKEEAADSTKIFDDDDLKEVENYKKVIRSLELELKTTFVGSTEVARNKERTNIVKWMEQNTNITEESKKKLEEYINMLNTLGANANIEEIHAGFEKIKAAEIAAHNEGKRFIDVFKEKIWYQWAAQIGSFFSFDSLNDLIKQGIQVVRELDTAMVEVKKVTDETDNSYKKFAKTISQTAKEIASTNTELLNSSADYLRLGYSLEEAANLAENTALFVNVGDGVDIEEATEDIITAMKAFDIAAEDSIKIVDSYNQIGELYCLNIW